MVAAKKEVVMKTTEIESKWNQLRGKLKQKYAQLTDDDLTFLEGKGEELLGRLAEKLGRAISFL